MAPTDFLAYLDDCVSTTEACSVSVQSSIKKLGHGVEDLPRLSNILTNRHHFVLLPQPSINAHKQALAQHLVPQINQLTTKAESLIHGNQSTITRLEERLNIINSARLPDVEPAQAYGLPHDEGDGVEEEGEEGAGSALGGIDMRGLSLAQRRKVIMLRAKRQRLEKEKRELEGRGEEV